MQRGGPAELSKGRSKGYKSVENVLMLPFFFLTVWEKRQHNQLEHGGFTPRVCLDGRFYLELQCLPWQSNSWLLNYPTIYEPIVTVKQLAWYRQM